MPTAPLANRAIVLSISTLKILPVSNESRNTMMIANRRLSTMPETMPIRMIGAALAEPACVATAVAAAAAE